MINNEVDKAFLLKQQETGRVGSMDGIDMKLFRHEQRREKRLQKVESCRQKYRSEADLLKVGS